MEFVTIAISAFINAHKSISLSKGLSICNVNICHILPKLDEIRLFISEEKFDLFGCCETFLSSVVKDEELIIKGYNLEHKDRSCQKGSGLIVYINDQYTCKRRADLEDSLESVWIEVCLINSKPFLLNFVYRPPSSTQNWIDQYELQFIQAAKINSEILLFGDFNIPFLDDNTCTNSKWSNFYNKYGLSQLVNVPTRISQSTSSIIDLVY